MTGEAAAAVEITAAYQQQANGWTAVITIRLSLEQSPADKDRVAFAEVAELYLTACCRRVLVVAAQLQAHRDTPVYVTHLIGGSSQAFLRELRRALNRSRHPQSGSTRAALPVRRPDRFLRRRWTHQ